MALLSNSEITSRGLVSEQRCLLLKNYISNGRLIVTVIGYERFGLLSIRKWGESRKSRFQGGISDSEGPEETYRLHSNCLLK
jgi:hypothetical protein